MMTEEEEFEARYQRESIRELRKANKRLQDVVNNLVGSTTAPKAPIVINAPTERVAKNGPSQWQFVITDQTDGMMHTITAYCDEHPTWTFEIERYRDGYIKQILATKEK